MSSLEMEADITLDQATLPWYLGIDFGTTSISAALFNRKSGEVYPIYWELVDVKPELNIPEINLEFTFSTKKLKLILARLKKYIGYHQLFI
ncbi:MAG: hypothetical protein O4804_06760 [Trichodesmium sp. St11_bin5]|nr:hypothetical protein [Trichodesmium sp. St11_bin5]